MGSRTTSPPEAGLDDRSSRTQTEEAHPQRAPSAGWDTPSGGPLAATLRQPAVRQPRPRADTEVQAAESSGVSVVSRAWLTLAWVYWGLSAVSSLWCFFAFFRAVSKGWSTALPAATEQANEFLVAAVALIRWQHFPALRQLTVMIACLVLAGIVVLRRGRDRMAVLVSGATLAIGVAPVTGYLVWGGDALARSPSWWMLLVSYTCLLFGALGMLALFPDGRLVPRFGWLAVPVWVVGAIAYLPRLVWSPAAPSAPMEFYYSLALLLCIVPLYRYRSCSSALQRYQLKWFVLAVVMGLIFLIGFPTLSRGIT